MYYDFRGYSYAVVSLSALCAIIGLHSASLYAQTKGSINGTVLDISGSAIPGAHLVLTNMGTAQSRTLESSAEGYFDFPDLDVGRYSLRTSARGFKELVLDSLLLTVGQQMTVRPKLEVGAVTELIEVTGAPPPVTTSSSSISHLVGGQSIESLPLNGRNALQLIALVPGVVSRGVTGQFGATQVAFEVGGGRLVDTNFTLDGGLNMNPFYNSAADYPNPDALEEFTVNTRTYTATVGRGFSYVSAVTKSGTNELHGSLYEFLRNTKLDSRPFFAANRSEFKRNQYGGTAGGPIRRNKTFFFFGYQGTKARGSPGETRYRTMTLRERAGDFSGQSKAIADPQNSGRPFPNNQIPLQRVRPFASRFITDLLPQPNSGSDFFAFTPPYTTDQNQIVTKVDHAFGANDRLSFRYLYNNVPQRGSGVSNFLDSTWLADLPTRTQSWNLGYVHIFSPRLINDAKITYIRNAYGVRANKKFSLPALGLDITLGNSITDFGMTPDTRLAVAGFFSARPGVATRDIVPATDLSNTTSWTGGKHKVEFGVQVFRTRVNQLQNFLDGGSFDFNGFASSNAAADFLLGWFSSYRQSSPIITRLRQTLPNIFVQDTIRAGRTLTVTLGLRWDPYVGWVSEDNVLAAFRPGVQSTKFPKMAPGLLYPGDAGLPRSITGDRLNNLAPRVGVAWDVRGDGRTAIRVGFGIYYQPTQRAIAFNRFPLIQPYALDVRLVGGQTDYLWQVPPFNGANPFPLPSVTDINALRNVNFTPTAGHTSFALPFKTQSDRQWSVSIQQAVGKNSVFDISYVGSSSSHLYTSKELNPAVYIPGQSTTANTQQRRLYSQFGLIAEQGTPLSANYNSLQISFSKRYTRGFAILSSYGWSKGLGVVGGAFSEGSTGPRDPWNYSLDYGRLDGDIRHNFVTSFIWDVPFGNMSNSRVTRYLARGWQMVGINTLRSGFPFTVWSGIDRSLTGIGHDTADQVGEWQLNGSRSRSEKILAWFNRDAFAQNAIGTFGTVGINSLTGPGFWNFDLGVTRRFSVTEAKRIDFRALAYNAFNRPSFGLPDATRSSPTFGRITSTASDPRVIEFGVKFSF